MFKADNLLKECQRLKSLLYLPLDLGLISKSQIWDIVAVDQPEPWWLFWDKCL